MNPLPAYRLLVGLCVLLWQPSFGQTDLTCNDNVQVSLGSACQTQVSADMILENFDSAAAYSVEIFEETGVNIGNTVDNTSLGVTLTVRVNLLADDGSVVNFCWGTLRAEDKLAPQISCPDTPLTLSCTEDPAALPPPAATDNCDFAPLIQLTNHSLNTENQCTDAVPGDGTAGTVTLTQTFIAADASGNFSESCTRTVEIQRPVAVDFPADIAFYCLQFTAFPNLTDTTKLLLTGLTANPALGGALDATDVPLTEPTLSATGAGRPAVAEGSYCNFGVGFNDETLTTCGDNFKIVRTWLVFDWCAGELVLFNDANDNGTQDTDEEDNVQVIKITDDTPPVLTAAAVTVGIDEEVSADAVCTSTALLPLPTATDACGAVTLQIFTPVGEVTLTPAGGNIPAPGLEVGTYPVTYTATDDCGNVAELTVTLTVVDNLPPHPVCDELTQVSLSADGTATVAALDLDDGSTDNCGIDRYEVRRMTDACGIGGNGQFGEAITFCCADIGQTTEVVLRVYDIYDNFNDCTVSVLTEDKVAPQKVTGVLDQMIDCDFYFDNLAAALDIAQAENDADPAVLNAFFGAPVYADNCDFTVQYFYTNSVNNCGEGEIIRQFSPIDESGNLGEVCVQTITVNHVSDFVVEFPADINFACGEEIDTDFGAPNVFFADCELVAVSFEDAQFDVVEDACFKLMRTYSVINWCIFDDFGLNILEETPENTLPGGSLDPDGDTDGRTFRDGLNAANFPNAQPDGFIQYVQEIKVTDEAAPLLTAPDTLFFGINETICATTVTLPELPTEDCSTEITLTVTSDLGEGFGPFAGTAPGDYSAIYTATDNCGNARSTAVVFSVADTKAPTPYCTASVAVGLMASGMVEVCAPLFDAGSFDNCTAAEDLIFSFDPADTSAVCMMFNCLNVNDDINLPVFVIDEAGNFDACLVHIDIQDNNLVCIARPEIAGTISRPAGTAQSEVAVHLNGAAEQITDENGVYMFTDLEEGEDYTVVPTDDEAYDSGVTTWDLLLIRRHILGVETLDSPYKLLAADANASGSISTADLIALKRILLHADEVLANSPSTRFVPADYTFPDPTDPWEEEIPEFINFNNLLTEEAADFIGIKIGDVSW